MFAALSANDRLAAIAAIIVVITGVISIAWNWGVFVIFSLLAGLGVLFVVFQPRIAPTIKIPMAKGLLMLILGGVAAIALLVTALDYIDWILGHLLDIDALQFLVGLVASLVMLYAGWRAFQAEKASAPATTPPAPPAPPTA